VENQVDVAAQREGVVVQVGADIGTTVRKGQVLARLDDRQLVAERDAARSKASAIEAEMQNWAAQQKVDEVDLQRAEGMWNAGLITQQQLDHARYRVTQSQFEAERERHNLENARSTLKALELELAKMVIVAPFHGVVARRYVRDGQKVAVGERLFWVSAVSPLRVRFTLPERFLGRVKAGDEIDLSAMHGAEAQHRARILKVSPVVDPSSATIEILAEVLGPTGDLRPGMTATLRIPERQ
jgi:membrane fusion protein (multidrug efflux system)